MYCCIVIVLDTTSEPVKARPMPVVSTVKSTACSHAKYMLKLRSHTLNTRPHTLAMTQPNTQKTQPYTLSTLPYTLWRSVFVVCSRVKRT